jgi:hypothetical protein
MVDIWWFLIYLWQIYGGLGLASFGVSALIFSCHKHIYIYIYIYIIRVINLTRSNKMILIQLEKKIENNNK